MAEYIEREALITAIHADTQHLQSFDESFADLLMIDIEEAPAADVAPVRHGRWEPVDARYSRCTNCKRERNIRTQIGWKFCPNCGAKMDGGESNG